MKRFLLPWVLPGDPNRLGISSILSRRSQNIIHFWNVVAFILIAKMMDEVQKVSSNTASPLTSFVVLDFPDSTSVNNSASGLTSFLDQSLTLHEDLHVLISQVW
jgi:hypothetical protein